MDQYEKLKTELLKKEREWEEAENKQRKAQKELQEQYQNVEEITQRLNRMLDEKYQEVLGNLRQVEGDTKDFYQILNNSMSDWHSQINQAHYRSLRQLDQKQEDLEIYYRGKYRKMQTEIDSIYKKYKE